MATFEVTIHDREGKQLGSSFLHVGSHGKARRAGYERAAKVRGADHVKVERI